MCLYCSTSSWSRCSGDEYRDFSFLNAPILNSSNSCMLRFYPRTWVHFVWNGTGHDRGAECPAAALSEGNVRCPNTQTRFGPVRPSSVRLGSVRFVWSHKEVYGRVESSSGSVWLLRPSVSITLAAPHVSVFAIIRWTVYAYTHMRFKSVKQFKTIKKLYIKPHKPAKLNVNQSRLC